MEEKTIYKNIIACLKDIKAIGKNSKNKIQGFMYRGIDDVMNELNPILSKNNVFIVPTILESTREEKLTAKGGTLIYTLLKVKYTFYAEDGSNIECIVIGEAMDSGDKSTNKAMSIAMKYALFQVFCIPTEDDPDKDSYTLGAKKTATKAVPQTRQQPKTTIPKLTEEQYQELIGVLGVLGLDDLEEAKKFKLNNFKDLTQDRFEKAKTYYLDLMTKAR